MSETAPPPSRQQLEEILASLQTTDSLENFGRL
jgi:hypothetical protein